jgi:hypothetical protein
MSAHVCLAAVWTGKATWRTCRAPATLECTYGPEMTDPLRHYRCDEHRPPPGSFYDVRPIPTSTDAFDLSEVTP